MQFDTALGTDGDKYRRGTTEQMGDYSKDWARLRRETTAQMEDYIQTGTKYLQTGTTAQTGRGTDGDYVQTGD